MRKKNPVLAELGKTIRFLREEKGYSQEAFADEVGLDRTYIGGVERGERNVGALNLIKIAISLNAEVGSLFPSIRKLKKKLAQKN